MSKGNQSEQAIETLTFDQLRGEVEGARERLNDLRQRLARYFVEKQELVDLMCVCTIAQEPLLIVGPPGTAKSDLVTKFCEALGLDLGDYFEYMLTKFTEPSGQRNVSRRSMSSAASSRVRMGASRCRSHGRPSN